ncbi:MAG: VWA domain-containing protein [Blautia sp.]|nr:VWA domain-containing protein [Blautia sp.]
MILALALIFVLSVSVKANASGEEASAVQESVSLAFIVDASGSMGFLADVPGMIRVPEEYPRETFLSDEMVDRLLDKEATDHSRLGFSGFRYYVEYNGTEYAPLGYWDGSGMDAEIDADGSLVYTIKNSRSEITGILRDAEKGNAGWYYVNSGSDKYLTDTIFGTSKSYLGIPGNAVYRAGKEGSSETREYSVDFSDPESLGKWLGRSFIPAQQKKAYPAMFFADQEGYLCCFHGFMGSTVRLSRVYERKEDGRVREEVLKALAEGILSRFMAKDAPPRISAVKFSGNAMRYEDCVLAEWTEGKDLTDSRLGQAEKKYGLTGGTSFRTGLGAYKELLHPLAGDRKYILLISDGEDSDKGKPDETGWNTRKYIDFFRRENYTILTVYLEAEEAGIKAAENTLRSYASLGHRKPLFWIVPGNGQSSMDEICSQIADSILE